MMRRGLMLVLLVACWMTLGCGRAESPIAAGPAGSSATASESKQQDGDGSRAESGEQPREDSAKDQNEQKEEQAAPADAPRSTSPPPGAVEEISFDDLDLRLQENIVFRPWMLSDRAKELDGRKVRIGGFMLADAQLRGIKEFVLLRNVECKFGPGGQPDHLAQIKLRDEATASFRTKPVEVEGVLKIKPFTGPGGITWSIYEISDVAEVTNRRR